EGDDPAFTQTLKYKAVAGQPSTRKINAGKLVRDGDMTEEQTRAIIKGARRRLEHDIESASSYRPNKADELDGNWSHRSVPPTVEERRGKTDVAMEDLRAVGKALVTVPDGFHLHSRLGRFMKARRTALETGKDLDWATGEALA